MSQRIYYLILRCTGRGHYEGRALVWRKYVKPLILKKAAHYRRA